MKNVVFAFVIGLSIIAIGISNAYADSDGEIYGETVFESKMYNNPSEPAVGEIKINSDGTCKLELKVTESAGYCNVYIGNLIIPSPPFNYPIEFKDVPVIDGELKLTEEECNFIYEYPEGIALAFPICDVQCDDFSGYVNAVSVTINQQQ